MGVILLLIFEVLEEVSFLGLLVFYIDVVCFSILCVVKAPDEVVMHKLIDALSVEEARVFHVQEMAH